MFETLGLRHLQLQPLDTAVGFYRKLQYADDPLDATVMHKDLTAAAVAATAHKASEYARGTAEVATKWAAALPAHAVFASYEGDMSVLATLPVVHVCSAAAGAPTYTVAPVGAAGGGAV